MYKNSLFLLLVLILASCAVDDPADDGITRIDLSEIVTNPEKQNVFNEVSKYVKLESNPDILLGSDLFFETHDDKFYILDRLDKQTVLVFNTNGDFINKVGKAGGGPEEFNQCIDFLVRNDTVDFLVQERPNSIVYSYLDSGEFIGKKELPIYGYSFQMVEDKYALSINYDKSASDYQVHLIGSNGEEFEEYLPNNAEKSIPVVANCFSTGPGQVFYFDPFNSNVYTFANSQLTPEIEFDFGAYNLPENFFSTDPMNALRMVNAQGASAIKTVFANSNYYFFEITCQKEGTTFGFHVFYDKNSHEIEYLALSEEDQAFSYPMGLTENDEMMYLVFPFENVDEQFQQFGLDLNIADFDETGNPAVVYCKL